MRTHLLLACCAAAALHAADPALTLYNRDFAVVRESVPLDLKPGETIVRFSDATAHLEPNSVLLRDPAGRVSLRVLEQNFFAEPVSQGYLLSLYEGKSLDFERSLPNGGTTTERCKLIRAGYVPHTLALQRYGQQYAMRQQSMAYSSPGTASPVLECPSGILFNLPGRPLFPALPQDALIKPTLIWRIASPQPVKLDAELSYLSGGFSWDADYNLVLAETGENMDITGWVTLDNQSGRGFQHAAVKLMAGDIQRAPQAGGVVGGMVSAGLQMRQDASQPQVTERTFDDYHVFTLERAIDLADRETKQIEFIRTSGVDSKRIYIYDGRLPEQNYYPTIYENPDYGIRSQPKVWILREFANTKANHLGTPLPKGRAKFYRRDRDGRLEFLGESNIDHTPREQTLSVYTGNAFDIVGSRVRTDFRRDTGSPGRRYIQETFEIKLTNRKTEPVTVRVVEHLDRYANWQMLQNSLPFRKRESHTVDFDAALPANGETTISYRVEYTW